MDFVPYSRGRRQNPQEVVWVAMGWIGGRKKGFGNYMDRRAASLLVPFFSEIASSLLFLATFF
jgi:hypothetical protein